jgi:hypothetical protein
VVGEHAKEHDYGGWLGVVVVLQLLVAVSL